MSNFKLIKTAAALALGASVVTSAVVPTDASAASKYKIVKGKLVIAKTGKVAKGYVTYKSLVYKDGKKLTGLKGKTYYKAGKKATGTYKGAYYYKGAKKITTGTYKGAYYVKGVKKVTTGLYNGRYYKSGVKATGTYKGAYYVKGTKKVTTGVYNGAYYVKGYKKVTTGVYNGAYYVKGVKKVTTGYFDGFHYVAGVKIIDNGFYGKTLYINGKENTGLALFEEKLFDGSALNKEVTLFEEKLFDGAKLNEGYKLYKEDLYKDEKLNTGKVVFDGKLYQDAKLSTGLVPFTEEGKKELVYNDGVLANGTFTVDGKEVAYENGIEVAAKVASVEAINATQVKVTFNKTVEKDSAEIAANYKYNNAVLADGNTAAQTPKQVKVALQDDKKSVIITFADVQVQKSSFSLSVDGVKDVAGNKVASDVFKVLVNDEEAPTISKVEMVPSGDVELTFSEPLSAVNPIVRINGTPVAITSVTAGDTKVVIPAANVPAIEKGATATVYVAGAKDTAGNEMALYNSSFVKPNDTTAPVITSYKQVSQNTVRVTLNKKLAAGATGLDKADFKVLKGSTIYTDGTDSSAFTVTQVTSDASGLTYDVSFTLGSGIAPTYGIYDTDATTQAVTIIIDKGAFKDGYGNENAAVSQAFTFNYDKNAPVLDKTTVSTDKQTIEVKFDKAISAAAASKIVVTNADGVRFTVDSATVKNTAATNGDEKTVVLDLIPTTASTQTMVNGEYTIQFQAGAVTDTIGNSNATLSTKAVVGDSADTKAPTVSLAGESTENKFVVKYSEEVSASALNLANYTLDGKSLKDSGASIYFTDTNKDTVTIELPKAYTNIGVVGTGTKALLNVANVTDKAGNAVASTNLTAKLSDNTSAKLQTVQVIGNDIVLTFNEAIDAASALAINDSTKLAADFDIKVAGTALNLGTTSTVATSLVAGNSKQVKISLTPGTGTNWDATKAVTVKVKGATLKDANLYNLEEGTVVSK